MKFDGICKELLAEIYLDKDYYKVDSKTKKVDKSQINLSTPSSNFGRKIGSYNAHDIYRRDVKYPNGTTAIFIAVKDNDVKLMIRSEVVSIPNVIRVKSLESKSDNVLKSFDLYHYLITDLGYQLISDSIHSVGGKKVWKKLMEYEDIKFFYSIKASGKFGKWKLITPDKVQQMELFWTEDESSPRGDLALKATR